MNVPDIEPRSAESRGYLIAVVVSAAAILVRWLLEPWVGDLFPFATLFGAVAVAAYYGGYGPAILATILCFLGAEYLFTGGKGTFFRSGEWVGAILYVVTCATIIGLGEAMRAAQRGARTRLELLRVTFASIGDGVIITDLEGKVVSLNRVAEALTGWRSAEAEGRPLAEVFRLVSEATGRRVVNPVAKVLSEGNAARLPDDSVLIAKDGTERSVDETGSPIRDASGKVLGAVLVFRDLTERKRDALRLAAKEAELHLVTSGTPILLTRCSRDMRYLFVNRACAEFFRTPAEQMVGKRIPDVIGEAAFAIILPHVERVLRGEHVQFEIEIPYEHVGRRFMQALYTPDRDEDGNVVGWIGTVSDVSARKQAEVALRESETRLTAFLEQLPVGAGLLDRSGRYVVSNAMLRRFAGSVIPSRDPENFGKWRSWLADGTLLPPSEWPGSRALRGDTVSPGIDFLHTTDDGREIWTRVSSAPFRDESGEVVGAVNVIQDIDAHKRAELALREADKRKDEFLAILAHELRNPLAPLRNAAHILTLNESTDPALKRPVEIIERQVTQMARLIDDLLDVSRVARGMIELRLERVEFAEIVEAVVDAARNEIDARGHRLAVHLPKEPLILEADRHRLVQIFGNLVSNAAKYTPPGGSIALDARAADGWLEVRVQDDGIGIPPENLSEIFDLFVQVDRSLGRQGGLGIGLTLARQLVTLHRGQIEARSAGLGQGSSFVVRIPAAPAAQAAVQPATDGSTEAVPSRKVLVADDNRDAAESMALILESAGHNVRLALDGEAALTVAAEFRPEVAFLDIGMPKRNGYEVARRIREEAWGKRMRLVALTGWGQEEDRVRSRDAGFDAHLVKPISPQDLHRFLTPEALKTEDRLR